MAVTYRKLWHMLIDRKMKKKELEASAGLMHYAITAQATLKEYSLMEVQHGYTQN